MHCFEIKKFYYDIKKEDCYYIHICNITFGFYVLSTYIYIYIFIEAIIICGLLLIKYTLNFHVYFFVMNICYELFDISNLVTLKLVSNK